MPRSAAKNARASADRSRGLFLSLLRGIAGLAFAALARAGFWIVTRLITHPRDSALAIVAAAAVVAIFINSLFLQTGPHPAPIFALRPLPVAGDEPTGALAPVLPRARPVEAPPAVTPARPRAEIISDVQRELARRGYYDAAVDGLIGAKTDAAIRDFEQASGLKSTGEPSEALLAAVLTAPPKARAVVATAPPPAAPSVPIPPAAPARREAISNALTSSQRMAAIQRALSEFGYGPVSATGTYGPETRAAVERFERTHSLPVTGEISDRVARELTAMTGRQL